MAVDLDRRFYLGRADRSNSASKHHSVFDPNICDFQVAFVFRVSFSSYRHSQYRASHISWIALVKFPTLLADFPPVRDVHF